MSDRYIKLKIEERDYALLPMPPVKAIRFAPKVAKLLSSVLGAVDIEKLATLTTNSGKEDDGKNMKIGEIVSSLLKDVDTDALIDLAEEAFEYEVMAGDGTLDGKLKNKPFFDNWFREYPEDLMPICIWAIWEHSAPFLKGSAKGFQKIMTNT